MKDEISEYSYHIFLFPFKWDFKKKNKDLKEIEFSRRTSLEAFEKILDNSRWQRKPFMINDNLAYNEFIYFYNFVHDALLDSGEKQADLLRQYIYKIGTNSKYIIKLKDKDSYELAIDKISLNVYSTGVGVLSYHLKNNTYSERSDIFKINEFGRRIYPQFLGKESKEKKESLTHATKREFLADKIEVRIAEGQSFMEDFSYFNSLEQVKENPSKLPAFISGLLGNWFVTSEKKTEKGKIHTYPVVDDRMFVMCWYANKNFCAEVSKFYKSENYYSYADSDDWYTYIFIDKEEPSCNSIHMKKELLLRQTYDRWVSKECCLLFGISRYSFVVLTDSKSFVVDHFKTMYFQMVQLALVQRASVLRFSDEVTDISTKIGEKDTTKRIRDLNEHYLQFINKLYFREVTAQEQGIELYDKIKQSMKIERDVEGLERDIDKLHQYASLVEDKRNNEQLYILTVLGAIFLIPAFIASFFGMNIFTEKMEIGNTVKYWTIISGIIFIAFISWLGLSLHNRWKGPRIPFLIKLIKAFIFITVFIIVFLLISGIGFSILGVAP